MGFNGGLIYLMDNMGYHWNIIGIWWNWMGNQWNGFPKPARTEPTMTGALTHFITDFSDYIYIYILLATAYKPLLVWPLKTKATRHRQWVDDRATKWRQQCIGKATAKQLKDDDIVTTCCICQTIWLWHWECHPPKCLFWKLPEMVHHGVPGKERTIYHSIGTFFFWWSPGFWILTYIQQEYKNGWP